MQLNLLALIFLAVVPTSYSIRYPIPEYHDDDYVGVSQQQQESIPPRIYLEQAKMKLAEDGKRRRGPKQQQIFPPLLQRANGNVDVDMELKNLTVSHRCVDSWPDLGLVYGSVSGVSLDIQGNVVMFHRADRVWSTGSFNVTTNVFLERNLGPIKDNTIIGIDRNTGKQVYAFGKGLFYLPHGITVDGEDVWVTDVGLHQVMKLNRIKSGDNPLMVLGTKFMPGKSRKSFCKPTSVAILPNGDFFVADGYCNARIMKFNSKGEFILLWGQDSFQGRADSVAQPNYLAIPHALTLALDKGLVCVADRENGRVQCFQHSDGSYNSQYHSPLIGDRLFSVAYAPIDGGKLFVVNGPVLSGILNEVKGFVIDMASGNVTAKFPADLNFTNPHDIAVTTNGQEIYVVEFEPYKIHKMIAVNARPNDLKLTQPPSAITNGPKPVTKTTSSGGTSVLLMVAVIAVFGLSVLGVALAVSRQRKRGCLSPFESSRTNRRHAWEFPKTGEFKLGAMLDKKRRSRDSRRGKFEKLGQESEDEEGTMLKGSATDNEINGGQQIA